MNLVNYLRLPENTTNIRATDVLGKHPGAIKAALTNKDTGQSIGSILIHLGTGRLEPTGTYSVTGTSKDREEVGKFLIQLRAAIEKMTTTPSDLFWVNKKAKSTHMLRHHVRLGYRGLIAGFLG